MEKKKSSFLRNETFLSVAAAIICILVGLLVGFLVLLAIKPEGAWAGILAIIKNFFNYPTKAAAMKYLGNTLVKTAPLLMCALSINFCYKVGLFNIGAAGQYVVGAAACLYAALAWNMPWYVCMILAMIAGGIFGLAVGFLKAYANVNEVISGIMLNWIGLYLTNMILGNVKESTSPYTVNVKGSALIPSLGLSALFSATNSARPVTTRMPQSMPE